MGGRTLWLGDASVAGDRLTIRYGIDHHHFSTALWWEDLDLDALRAGLGELPFRRLVFHITAFEAMKAASLRPGVLDLGPWADLGTAHFRALWSTVRHHVWAQWRYEHDLPHDPGPRIAGRAAPPAEPVRAAADPSVLLFCGGGKDSLVAGRVLEEAGVPYASYAYAHSTYGPAGPQHALIDRLLDHLAPTVRRRHEVVDDLIDAPIERFAPELGRGTVVAAETPASLFGALPLALAQGHTDLVLAHERSADVGNLVWARTGEEVNRQWGKSLAAERLLQTYVATELAAGVTYASALKPVHDVLIFRALAESLDAVPATHSCNVAKPWCLRCAKCAYVWLGYQAFLPAEVNRTTFGDTNLLDDTAVLGWFEQLLGLAEHTPFECTGLVEETRLCFELLRRRGATGAAIDRFGARVDTVDAERLYAELVAVGAAHHAMPAHLASAVMPVLDRLGSLPL